MVMELSEHELQRARVDSEMKLNNNGTFNIRKKLRDSCREYTLEKKLYDILADSVAIQESVRNKIKQEIPSLNASEFGLIFSSYVSAEFGLEELISVNGSSDTLVKGFDFFDNYHINFQEIYPRPLNEMLLCLSESFDYPSEGGVVRLVENYFNWVKIEATQVKNDAKYLNFSAEVQKEGLKVKNRIFKDFNLTSTTSHKSKNWSRDWNDLGGYEEQKQYFQDMEILIKGIDHCSECKDYMPLEDRLVKGTLLVGPPGTGKTFLTQIFIEQVGIPYDMFSISDVGSKYVNESTGNLSKRFENAARHVRQGISPVFLLYMMEIDAMARQRGEDNGNKEDSKMVTELNLYMRGPKSTPGVIVVADSNHPEELDHAIVSPGRFGRIHYMGYPNPIAREKILSIYTDKYAQVDIDHIVKMTDNSRFEERYESEYYRLIQESTSGGYTPADLKEIRNIAMRIILLDHLNCDKKIRDYTIEDWVKAQAEYNETRGWKT